MWSSAGWAKWKSWIRPCSSHLPSFLIIPLCIKPGTTLYIGCTPGHGVPSGEGWGIHQQRGEFVRTRGILQGRYGLKATAHSTIVIGSIEPDGRRGKNLGFSRTFESKKTVVDKPHSLRSPWSMSSENLTCGNFTRAPIIAVSRGTSALYEYKVPAMNMHAYELWGHHSVRSRLSMHYIQMMVIPNDVHVDWVWVFRWHFSTKILVTQNQESC